MEMVVNGVSTRKVSHIVEELCERQIFKSTVSKLSKGLSEEVNQFKNRPLGEYCYVITDALYVKVREDLKVAVDVTSPYHQILGLFLGPKNLSPSR